MSCGEKDGVQQIPEPADEPEVSQSFVDSEMSRSESGPGGCESLRPGFETFRACVAAAQAQASAETKATEHCKCLEAFVRLQRSVLVNPTTRAFDDARCGAGARRTYFATNASLGVVCPSSTVFDPSGAPCGMPGQKVFDNRLIPNWVGVKSKGYLVESLEITYFLGAVVLAILALVLLVIFIVVMKLKGNSIRRATAAKAG
jgi:hypothetical protein